MSAKWLVGDARWNKAERRLVEDIFRRWVDKPSKPGRIHREGCPFCRRERKSQCTASEFHHLSYRNPFRGVWCCNSHHRKIEHGTVKVREMDIWDYRSLIPQKYQKRYSEQVNRAHATRTYAKQRRVQ